jgi:hypothetical protein
MSYTFSHESNLFFLCLSLVAFNKLSFRLFPRLKFNLST